MKRRHFRAAVLLLELAGTAQAFILGFQLSSDPIMDLLMYPYTTAITPPADLTACQNGPSKEIVAVGVINGLSQGLAANTRQRMRGIALWEQEGCPPLTPDYMISWREDFDGMQLADLARAGKITRVGSWMDLDADNVYLQAAGEPSGYIYDFGDDKKIYIEGGKPVVINGERKTTAAARQELILKGGDVQRDYAREIRRALERLGDIVEELEGGNGGEDVTDDRIPGRREDEGEMMRQQIEEEEPLVGRGPSIERGRLRSGRGRCGRGGGQSNTMNSGTNRRGQEDTLRTQSGGIVRNPQPVRGVGGRGPQSLRSDGLPMEEVSPWSGYIRTNAPNIFPVPQYPSQNMISNPPQNLMLNPYQNVANPSQNVMSNPFSGFSQGSQPRNVIMNPPLYLQVPPTHNLIINPPIYVLQQAPNSNTQPQQSQGQPGLRSPLEEAIGRLGYQLGRTNPMAPIEETERRTGILDRYLSTNDEIIMGDILGPWSTRSRSDVLSLGLFPQNMNVQLNNQGQARTENPRPNQGHEEITEEIRMSQGPQRQSQSVQQQRNGNRNSWDPDLLQPTPSTQQQQDSRLGWQSQFRLYTGVEESNRPENVYQSQVYNFQPPPTRPWPSMQATNNQQGVWPTQEPRPQVLPNIYNNQVGVRGSREEPIEIEPASPVRDVLQNIGEEVPNNQIQEIQFRNEAANGQDTQGGNMIVEEQDMGMEYPPLDDADFFADDERLSGDSGYSPW
ncbi:hypothetical protein TWF281_005234 [Arthrobotrys megalospora]